jgi:hypothetical protein
MARRPTQWGTDKDQPAAAPPAATAAQPAAESAPDPAQERAAPESWGATEADRPVPLQLPAWTRSLGDRAGLIALWSAPVLLALVATVAWFDARGVAAPQIRTPGAAVLTAEIVLAPGDTRPLEAICRDYDLPVRQCEASAACARSAAPGAGPRSVRLVLSRGAADCGS